MTKGLFELGKELLSNPLMFGPKDPPDPKPTPYEPGSSPEDEEEDDFDGNPDEEEED